jgi:hypothetical protein
LYCIYGIAYICVTKANEMKANKLTPGEQLYAASNDVNFWSWMAEKKEADKKVKAEHKRISDAKFQEAKIKYNIQPEAKVVVTEDAPKYQHGRFGIGLFVCEDETTITLSFNGEVKKMVKAYTKLTKI